jgi:hypothetical protein
MIIRVWIMIQRYESSRLGADGTTEGNSGAAAERRSNGRRAQAEDAHYGVNGDVNLPIMA